jgi:hypothetical protein
LVGGGEDKADLTDQSIEAVAELTDGQEDSADQNTPIALLYTKTQLLSMIRELHVHEIPETDAYQKHIALHNRNKLMGKSLSITISMRPRAVGQLMKWVVDRVCGPNHPTPLPSNSRNPYDFVRDLSHFDIDHLCVQLPVMDQHLEDSLLLKRTMPRNFFQIEFPRMVFRRLLVSALHDDSDYFFGLFKLTCRTLTIHNVTLGLFNRALASVSPGVPTVRAFFRPCTNADVDLVDKICDRYCYNHLTDGTPNISEDGELCLGNAALDSRHHIEFIDIDWIRGKYDPTRCGESAHSLKRQVDLLLKPKAHFPWAKAKTIKLSREAEGCVCCGNHQLSVVEVCGNLVRYYGMLELMYNAEFDQLQGAELKEGN